MLTVQIQAFKNFPILKVLQLQIMEELALSEGLLAQLVCTKLNLSKIQPLFFGHTVYNTGMVKFSQLDIPHL